MSISQKTTMQTVATIQTGRNPGCAIGVREDPKAGNPEGAAKVVIAVHDSTRVLELVLDHSEAVMLGWSVHEAARRAGRIIQAKWEEERTKREKEAGARRET